MTVPSKNFTTILNSAVDVDSPVDTVLMTALRDNDIHLSEWLGYGFTAAQAHDHDGVNSKLLAASIFGNLYAFNHFR